MDIQKQRDGFQTSLNLKLSNGYILPEGRMTPNTLFVGGIDMKVDENEIRDFFARFGAVKEVKIITYRGGICKGYGFVYFNEDVNIQTIIDQQISFKGRKLKLGPAIMKERSSRSMPSHLVGQVPWMSPSQYIYCTCCSPVGVAQPSPVLNGAIPTSRGVYLVPSCTLFTHNCVAKHDSNTVKFADDTDNDETAYREEVGELAVWCQDTNLSLKRWAVQAPINIEAVVEQPYSYNGLQGVMMPQMPMSYSQTAYAYQYASPHWTGEQRTRLVNQNFVDCGVQTLLTLL